MTNFISVKKFMQTFGQEVKTKSEFPSEKVVKLRYDFSDVQDEIIMDLSGNGNHGILNGGYVESELIDKIPNTTLPYRTKPGRFFSQAHKRNDMVGGKWVHQKDTSINEKRFVEEVQGGMIDIDEDGKRRIRKETAETRYNRGAKNFPQKSYHTEII